MLRLTLFDLDHTLLDGDSDALWCEYLMDRGLLDRASFAERNAAMERDYRLGCVSAQDFCDFYVGTLAGRSQAEWAPWRREFVERRILPRIPAAAHALVRRHRDAGDRVVLTTATNRFLSELTALHLGIADLIATECEFDAQDRFTGRTRGTPNMREGKVARLTEWLGTQQLTLADCDSTLYSDSNNDLPLLMQMRQPVAVDPDETLAVEAAARGWPVIHLHGGAP